MRIGIHLGYESEQGNGPGRAWVSEAPGMTGEWLPEAAYRAGGYAPDFDSLPVIVVQRVPISDEMIRHIEEQGRDA